MALVRIEDVAGDLPGSTRHFACGCCSRKDGWMPAGEAAASGWAILLFETLGRVMACPDCMGKRNAKGAT